MAATDPSQDKYMLSTGEQAAERLFLLNEIFGPGTRELLLVAGISAGMRVFEVGSRTGLVSLGMAQVVGTAAPLLRRV